jgi:transcription-repair coupling factor (superfamily II helicase)
MNEHQLEDIIVDFWQKKYDVLVATTIIESGLDIPNANTLIVDRAENFGLSQLHQIRGRVGRGRERGYAYFFYAADRPLSETAHDRLSTIAAHTELGAGMAVAMKDLEIRGAGNLLGGEQSGHIADVGFDLYVRMVGQAVAEVRNGGAVEEATPIRIELPIDAHLPHDYIREERLRLQSYRSLANATTNEQIVEVVTELVDRFGALPPAVENLVEVARLRLDLAAVGITEAIGAGNTLRLSPVALADSRAMRLSRLYPGSINKAAARTIVVPRPRGEHDVLEWVRTLIKTVLVD